MNKIDKLLEKAKDSGLAGYTVELLFPVDSEDDSKGFYEEPRVVELPPGSTDADVLKLWIDTQLELWSKPWDYWEDNKKEHEQD